MNSLEKSLREERFKKIPKNPSFSSSLLDEIYRSIDDGAGGKEKVVKKKQSIIQNIGDNGGGRGGGSGSRATSNRTMVEDEEMARLRRACLIEKWMEMKASEKAGRRTSSLPEFDRRSVVVDNDPMFFSSGSSSSDSSFGWGPETDQTAQPPKLPNTGRSCFGGAFKPPKPIRTSSVLPQSHVSTKAKQNEFYLFDDHRYDDEDDQTNKTNDGLIKSKTRALKIYANLKKMKQPISPGGRLTAFLNTLFATGKTTKELNSQQENISERFSSSTQQAPRSTCSSASSFSRSCLSKTTSPRSTTTTRDKSKIVRFYPVSVIVDEESRPCGQKTIDIGRKDALESRYQALAPEKNGNADVTAKNYHRNIVVDDEDEEDMSSDSSSDLFELDHLASLSDDNRFCEELPVYETTNFGSVFIR